MVDDNENSASQEPQTRKATDVLLALESKVDILQKLIYNQDMLIKLIADRSNKIFDRTDKIFAYIEELKQEYVAAQQDQVDPREIKEESKIVKVPIDNLITETREPVSVKRNARPEPPVSAPTAQLTEEPATDEKNERKVPVMQRVSDHTGKDIFMSQVIISDENGKEVYKTKTNAVGKWQAILKPGKYIIDITKTDTTTQKILKSTQNITVNNSKSTITLPVVIINR